jgi:hypothetical protein
VAPESSEIKSLASGESESSLEDREPASVISMIEKRIAASSTPQQANDWVSVLTRYLAEKEKLEQRTHKRSVERLMAWFQMGYSVVALATGTSLVVLEFSYAGYAGLFMIGAGLYRLCRPYVMGVLGIVKRERNERVS